MKWQFHSFVELRLKIKLCELCEKVLNAKVVSNS